MAHLDSPVNADTDVLPVSERLSSPSYPLFYTLDAETVKVTAGADTTEWQVERGVGDTVPAHHISGTPLVSTEAPFGGGSAEVLSHSVTLTNAQIKALPTTAVEIVPAVADGIIAPLLFAIRPDWWTDNPNAAAYTNFAEDNSTGFAFTDPVTGNDVSEYLEFATASNRALLSVAGPFPKPGSSRAAFIFHPLLGEYVSSGYFRQRFGAADVLNSINLYAYNTGGDFTGGHADNTMTVTVHYVVLSV